MKGTPKAGVAGSSAISSFLNQELGQKSPQGAGDLSSLLNLSQRTWTQTCTHKHVLAPRNQNSYRILIFLASLAATPALLVSYRIFCSSMFWFKLWQIRLAGVLVMFLQSSVASPGWQMLEGTEMKACTKYSETTWLAERFSLNRLVFYNIWNPSNYHRTAEWIQDVERICKAAILQ